MEESDDRLWLTFFCVFVTVLCVRDGAHRAALNSVEYKRTQANKSLNDLSSSSVGHTQTQNFSCRTYRAPWSATSTRRVCCLPLIPS